MMKFFERILASHNHCGDNEFTAVADGSLIAAEEIPDSVFSQKLLGESLAIVPRGDSVVAPADGKITMIFPTGHAFGMTLGNGMELLVHIGLDTVSLKGKGFQVTAREGEMVRRGDEIVKIDRDYIIREGYDPVIIMIFTQTQNYQMQVETKGEVLKGRSVVAAYQAAG